MKSNQRALPGAWRRGRKQRHPNTRRRIDGSGNEWWMDGETKAVGGRGALWQGTEQAGASSTGAWCGSELVGGSKPRWKGRLEEWNEEAAGAVVMQEVCVRCVRGWARVVEEGPAIGLIHDLYTARHQCTSDGSSAQQSSRSTAQHSTGLGPSSMIS